jgi:hypothetical protein
MYLIHLRLPQTGKRREFGRQHRDCPESKELEEAKQLKVAKVTKILEVVREL